MENQSYTKTEVLVKFMSPGSRLAGITYDEKGNKIKDVNVPFSKEEIAELKAKGIEKLYYIKEKQEEKKENIDSPAPKAAEKIEGNKVDNSHKTNTIETDEAAQNEEFISDIVQRARVLMANFNLDQRNYFIPRFIANGLALYRVDHAGDLKETISKYKISHCLINIETDGKEWVKALEEIRTFNDQFQILVFYGQSSKSHLSQLSEHGFVTASFLNSTDKKDLAKNVVDAINLHDPYFSKRSHLKALARDEDNFKVDIYLSEKQIISGKAYSVSPLDITVALSKDMKGEMYNFSVGDKIPRLGLSLSGKITVIQAEVINLDFSTSQIMLKFSQKSESLLSILGKLMMDKFARLSF